LRSPEFEYVEIPTTPPSVFQVVPSQSSNFGGVKVNVFMSNFKTVPDVSLLRVEVTLEGVSILLDPSDAESNIMMSSQMSQTMVSFTTPAFSVGGVATVQAILGTSTLIVAPFALILQCLPDTGPSRMLIKAWNILTMAGARVGGRA